MVSKDIYKEIASYNEEQRTKVVTKAVTKIIHYLKDEARFEEQKAFNFVFFLLAIITSFEGGITKEQYDIFSKATGLSIKYEDISKYFNQMVEPGDEERILPAIRSYNSDIQTNIVLLSLVMLSVKGSFTEKEMDYIHELESCVIINDNIKVTTGKEMGVSDNVLSIQDEIMAKSREERKDIVLNTVENITKTLTEKGMNKDRILMFLLYMSLWFVSNDYGDEHHSEYLVINEYVPLEVTQFKDLLENSLNEERNEKHLQLVKETETAEDFVVLGISLAALDGIISQEVLLLCDKILNY